MQGRHPLSLLTAFAASSPKGTPYGNAGNFAATAEAVPLRDDFPRSGGRCRVATKGGVWLDAKRQDGRGTSPIFSLPCNDTPRSTVCSTGKVSEFCPAAEGRKADRMPVLGRKSCAFLQILTELSQKIRRPAIESIRLACIIGMLGTHCPIKREELLRRAVRQRNGRIRWKNSVSKNHLRCWLQSSWC